MKKIIALLLALVMTFSVATVAFAADDVADDATTTTAPAEGENTEDGAFDIDDIDLGEFSWLLDLPLWTAKPLLKVAKIALKFVKVYFKLSELVGNIPDGVADQLEQIIKDTIAKAEQDSAEPETTTAAAIA
jgi:hypothetical protein